MKNWYMLTLVGNDRTGIVAKVTKVLYQHRCNLGEASMLRLGGNFTIMMMVNSDSSAEEIVQSLEDISQELELRVHIDHINGRLHEHHIPNMLITVMGADRSGLIAQVTDKLFQQGFDILNLDSDVAGTDAQPIYIMRIEGLTTMSVESVRASLQSLANEETDISVQAIDTMIG